VNRDDGERVSATEFLLELLARPETIADLPVVRVDHPGLHALLERSPDDGARVSLRAIEPYWPEIVAQAERADAIPARQRDGFQREAITLYNRVSTLLSHQQMHEPYVVPPLGPGEEWRGFRDAFEERIGEEPHPAVAHIATILGAQHEGDTEGFEKATRDYVALLRRDLPDVMRRMEIETLYNRASLFTGAAATYVLASLAIIGSFLLRARQNSGASVWGERLRTSGVWLILAALVVHTAAIALRMWLQGRPPVTNLYSSAIFVGWAAALFGVYIERLHPLGVAALASASVGFATLVVAHNLGNDGDTMQMMQAVLDTNFWLATHVVTITLGYSATFLAGALGAAYLIARCTTRWLTRERATSLSRMIYGTVCFALLLSFVGTVLGGIWADQSWGRFWGWDPKENGAALVVLINAIILHARWGGIVKQRGVAALAVLGNIVTAWSWFGTNMLGVGLHAYGFMDSAARWMWIFVASQVFIASMALLAPRGTSASQNELRA
jgi:ABC-type transport system involved in cytochrome c biogenesis permease subunit